MDTACSASFTALNVAIMDLKQGNIDYALIAGVTIFNKPQIMQIFQENGLISPKGRSAPLDEKADGFVKGEAIVCILLQRRFTARRVYARVVSQGINNDGKKTLGMFCPSSEAHEELMVNTYTKAGVDPLKVTYFEGHITGTKAGDPQEVKAIFNAYCERPGRSAPLPLGSVKSNMGHAEGASGLTSLTKVLIAFENECIPPNRNFKHLRHELKQYCPPLMPINDKLEYKPGLAAINNFGIGGVNCHVIVEPNYKLTASDSHDICESIPRLVTICGRTEDAVKYIMNFIESNAQNVTKDFLALLCESMKYTPNVNSSGFPYRGTMIIKKLNENKINLKYNYMKHISVTNEKMLRPFWLVFPGLGGQWPAMAKALMPIKTFASKVEECHQILQEFGIDLKHLLLSEDKTSMSTMTAKFCSTTALQIALYEVIKGLDITPDGIIGHSFGEIACAYADGCLSTRDAMIVTYFRGAITESDQQIPKGLMAVIGLSKAEALNVVSNGVYVVCNNAKDLVVISGPMTEMRQTMDSLANKGVFVLQLQSSEIPYHSHYLRSSAQPMMDAIKKHMPNPKLRSSKWLSTSLLTAKPDNELLGYASAEYFVHNLMNPVHFYDRIKHLPQNTTFLEISPHNIFNKILTQSVTDCSYLSLITENSNHKNLDQFVTTIAKLYELGYNPSIESLYPRVDWPVPRGTPSISSLIRWDRSKDLTNLVPKWPQNMSRSVASDMNVTVNLKTKKDSYLSGHVIDGNNIFPGTGYLMLVWRQLATYYHTYWYELPVIFSYVQFLRATFLSTDQLTRLTVQYFKQTGDFCVLENDNICAVGNVRVGDDSMLTIQQMVPKVDSKGLVIDKCEYVLDRPDMYKEMHIMGYEFEREFQSLLKIQTQDFEKVLGCIEWTGNMVTFLDGLLQSQAFVCPFRKLMVPVMITSIKCDPQVLFEALKSNQILSAKKQEDRDDRDLFDGYNVNVNKTNDTYCKFQSQLTLIYDSTLKYIVTNGVEIQNMSLTPINYKNNLNDIVLEKYEFRANHDMQAIDPNIQKQLQDYIEVCKSLAVLIKKNCLSEMKCDFNYQDINDDLLKLYRQSETSDNYVLFNILDEIYTKLILDFKSIKNIINEIQLKPNLDIKQDLINQIVVSNEPFLRSLVELIGENLLPLKTMTITEVNLTGLLLMTDIERYLVYSQILFTDIEYQLVVKPKQSVPMDQINDDNVFEWDLNESLVLKLNHLLILRDSRELWELDLEDFLQDLYDSLENNGFLLTLFRYRFTEPEVALNSLFGKTINDLNLDKRINDFINQANCMGFKLVCSKCDTIASKALLFRKHLKVATIPDPINVITIHDKCEQWFETLKNKFLMTKTLGDNSPKIWLIANESCINGVMGLWKTLRLESGGEHFRYIFVYDNNNNSIELDFNVKPFSDILANDLTANVIKDGRVGSYRYIKFAKHYDKIVSNKYYLGLGKTNNISSLKWIDTTNQVTDNNFHDVNNIQRKLIPVHIYSSGLIFRDVMVAIGQVSLSSQYFDTQIGLEFAGRRADTGQRVMGLNSGKCFATETHLADYLFTTIPSHWSMNESITILSTYFTVWYGLIAKANMKKGESILIHSAAGGVGQAAINVCQHYGCDIYVTCGSDHKKEFLINTYNIPENRIYSSRNIDFHHKIMLQTKGLGLNLVLNSLTGDKLDASYELLAKSGRFIEIGKIDMIQNKKLSMYKLLNDISFIGISLGEVFIEQESVLPKFYHWLHNNCTNGCVKPLNITLFKAQEVKEAFRHMTTGKHIGKIVVSIREEEDNQNEVIINVKSAPNMLVNIQSYFNPNYVYVIIGGLGGMGLELTQWMVYNGAKRLVLTSRSGIQTNYQKYIINRLIEFGKQVKHFETQVIVLTENCLTQESAKRVLIEAQKLGPIGGVFQLSLELNNSLLEDMSYEMFIKTVDIKDKVCRNLDQMTRQMVAKLDYFVIFSSIASGYGFEGQTNYTYGNSITERVCEQRQRDGFKGLAIQWGPIGDVGAMADMTQIFLVLTFKPQKIYSCCDILGKLLTVKDPIITVNIKSIRNEVKTKTIQDSKAFITNLWKSLGIDPQSTPAHLTLGEIGIESMFAAELQQEFSKLCGQSVAINVIKGMSVELIQDFESRDDNHIIDYFKGITRAQMSLSKYKFVFTSETHVRLNNIKKGKPLYVLPPLEVDFGQYDQLVNNIDRPVIGLNWTPIVDQLLSLKDVIKYFVDLMAKLEPNGGYDVLGVMDGSIICNKLIRKGRADVAVIMDVLNKQCYRSNELSDNCIIDLVYDCLSDDIPVSIKTRGTTNDNDLNNRLKKMGANLRDFTGKSMVSQDLDQVLETMFRRIRWFSNYRSTKQQKFGNDLKSSLQLKWQAISDTNKRLIVLMSDQFADNNDIDIVYLIPNSSDLSVKIAIDRMDNNESICVSNATVIDKLTKIIDNNCV